MSITVEAHSIGTVNLLSEVLPARLISMGRCFVNHMTAITSGESHCSILCSGVIIDIVSEASEGEGLHSALTGSLLCSMHHRDRLL